MNRIIILLFIVSSCRPQRTDRSVLLAVLRCGEIDCLCYQKKAAQDFKEGKKTLFSSGLIESGSFNDHYSQYLEKSEGINIVWGGDAFHPMLVYYNQVMIDSLRSRFGEKFFDSCSETVTLIYGKKNQRQNKVELFHCY